MTELHQAEYRPLGADAVMRSRSRPGSWTVGPTSQLVRLRMLCEDSGGVLSGTTAMPNMSGGREASAALRAATVMGVE